MTLKRILSDTSIKWLPMPSTRLDALPDTRTATRLGLALSGGGSRAAAFHCGTLQGLREIGLLDELDVVSSVSGGSVFAGAWLAAQWRGYEVGAFLDEIRRELANGFIAR